MQQPELLAPAGDWDCARAAVENGADAIYFGLETGFNARARAHNFSIHDLPKLMEFLHQRNVLGYVTFNTLVFADELPLAASLIREIATCQVDAMLVQDIGLARLAKSICPALPLHASTQMTMTSAETIALAADLGIERVVVARELSIEEIKAIRRATSMPIETFVHGALCVAYSGQCLTSESLGGRSANRGQCAQACRLAYDLLADGQHVDLGDQKYLLSPQDLAAYELTPDLLEAGVCSLKIEGRLKTPEYVASITRHYRQAIDLAVERKQVHMSAAQQYEMEMTFSRGFSPGWLSGSDHKQLVPATSSAKRGVQAGRVLEIRGPRVLIESTSPLRTGDGIVFDGDRLRQAEQGGRIYGIDQQGKRVKQIQAGEQAELSFSSRSLDVTAVSPGTVFWKTDDPVLNGRLRKTYQVADPVRRVGLDLRVVCRAGEPLFVEGRARNGAACRVFTNEPLERARKHPADLELLREQLGRLGGTVYELHHLDAWIEGGPLVPFSVLGTVRREILAQLNNCPLRSPRELRPEDDSLLQPVWPADPQMPASTTSELWLLCRNREQLRAAVEDGVRRVYAEFQDIREYAQAVPMAHENGAAVYLVTPRIQKPGELGIFRALSKHQADGALVRNFAALAFFHERGIPVVADFSMNVTNPLTVEYLLSRGAGRVTASYDLNREQLLDLVKSVPAGWLETVIHQHMPMFHMEHCVFCAVLSPGTDKTNCGRPCDFHAVELRDRIGMKHPLTADVGCRNTVYNARPQSSAEIVPSLQAAGVRHFRVELLRESAHQTLTTYRLYRDLLSGQVPPREVWKTLKANNRVGVTRGTLEDRNPLAII